VLEDPAATSIGTRCKKKRPKTVKGTRDWLTYIARCSSNAFLKLFSFSTPVLVQFFVIFHSLARSFELSLLSFLCLDKPQTTSRSVSVAGDKSVFMTAETAHAGPERRPGALPRIADVCNAVEEIDLHRGAVVQQ
jgi:hypothetical protein